MRVNPLNQDLEYIFKNTADLWDELRGQQIFITGGTGFFGCWLLESFLWINNKLALNAKLTVLTRNIANFKTKYPYLATDPSLRFHEGDLKDFIFPEQYFSHIIHAATDTQQGINPLLLFDNISLGTRRVLEFARKAKTRKFLLTSSGAVYGKQLAGSLPLAETAPLQSELMDIKSTYALGKLAAEHLGYLYAQAYNIDIKIARCFAFVGPYMPLNSHFAIGNFIADGLQGKPVLVNGDGTALRSYLYAADLAIWLWTILLRGKSIYPYNVGSNEAYSIDEVAHLVANSFAKPATVQIMQPKQDKIKAEQYIPDIRRAREELKLAPQVNLVDAINATKSWHQRHVICNVATNQSVLGQSFCDAHCSE